MRTGLDPRTGKVLKGWDHCVMCLGKLLTTRINSRVMHRNLGCDVPALQDQNATSQTILQLYVSIAEAIEDGEPGFLLKTIEMTTAGRDGRFVFEISGNYFPYGHRGDFSLREVASVAIGTNRAMDTVAA